MKKNTGIIIGGIVLIVIVGIFSSSANKKDEVMKDKKTNDSTTITHGDETMMKDVLTKESETMKKDDAGMMDKEMDKEMKKDDAMMKAGIYEEYAPEKLAKAETGDVVLFFHATWCPSCRSLSSDIENNISSIPEGLSILKVDYDKESEMKKKYGVTYQHTLVQVDKDGNLIKKWSGSSSLTSLISEIK